MKRSFLIVIIVLIIGVSVFYFSIRRSTENTSSMQEKLSVRVAILYEPITRYKPFNRTVDDIVKVIDETGADFVFRCFWRWSPCPETPEQLPPGRLRERCEYAGYYYQHLKQVISAIKASKPDIILCGAIPAQKLDSRVVWNPVTGEVISYPDTWEMALDPGKWGIPVEKEEFQC